MSTVLGTSNFAIKNHEKRDKESTNQSLVKIEDIFETTSVHEKTKATFQEAVDIFCKRDVRRTGHVEFIYAALKKMPEFGVEKDVNVYNKVLDVFPKKVFIPQNIFQKMLKYYPRQQDCAVQLLEQMEHFGMYIKIARGPEKWEFFFYDIYVKKRILHLHKLALNLKIVPCIIIILT